MFECEVCNNEITNLEEGLFIRIENKEDNTFKRIACVHKGECDSLLEAGLSETAYTTNTFIHLSDFDSDEERFHYFETGDKLID